MPSHRTSDNDVERTGERSQISEAIADMLEERVTELANVSYLENRKCRRTARRTGFGRRVKHRWGGALDALEELVATSAELGDLVAQNHHDDSRLFSALELLRNRAVQVGWEVHTLAASGYADGAYGRWRTLHELAVVSEFLREFGEDAAARYFDYAHVKNRKIIREYNECQVRLGYPRIPQADVDRSDRLRADVIQRYGPNFRNEWGWAAKACGNPNPSFFDLRDKAGYAHWKAHFGMANHALHAGPHGVLFRLGHPLGSDPLPLSGPSLVGLGSPIEASAISLMHATFSFVSAVRKDRDLHVESELEITALMKFITTLADRTSQQVKAACDRVEREFGRSATTSEK